MTGHEPPAGPGPLELLRIQAEAALDGRGRLAGCYGVTIASCASGQALWIGAEVPAPIADQLEAAFARSALPRDPTEAPPALEGCARILETTAGALARGAGPSYLIPPGTAVASEVVVERSDRPLPAGLRAANPGNWDPVEWGELLDGRLGPWTLVMAGAQAVSICHTPGAMTARAAECGVWTAPGFRGRGLAAATAAAWVPLVRAPGRWLYYSTDADNRSSQRVAERLGLRLLGWTWRLHRAPDRARRGVHPLCSLASAP